MELDKIRAIDSDVAKHIEEELARQQTTIELIASENFTSEAVMAACGTVLTNKYAEGKPHKRYYNGCEHIDVIEELREKQVHHLPETSGEDRQGAGVLSGALRIPEVRRQGGGLNGPSG